MMRAMEAVGWVWDWINGNGAGLGALAALATAAVAIFALVQAAADSRERSRPMMTAEFRKPEHSDSAIDLVVRNAGPAVARDVEVALDPPIELPADTSELVAPHIVRRYSRTIPSVAPGQELTNVWYSADYRAQRPHGPPPNREPTPDRVTVQIRYRGRGRKQYTDTFPLDVDVVRLMTYSTSSTSVPGRMESIDKSLAALVEPVRAIARAANYVRREDIAAAQSAAREKHARLVDEVKPRAAPSHDPGRAPVWSPSWWCGRSRWSR